jgi:hypothetical protein
MPGHYRKDQTVGTNEPGQNSETSQNMTAGTGQQHEEIVDKIACQDSWYRTAGLQ